MQRPISGRRKETRMEVEGKGNPIEYLMLIPNTKNRNLKRGRENLKGPEKSVMRRPWN